ncbi:MAG: hypothetical protein A2V90_06105 [Gammaproteobacteria bacterium RBG_16_57_12]|nr:MAG: hypothetical protein A2V90_06105 [Gammaproteobacteria bacterium RBG_16_57_12]
MTDKPTPDYPAPGLMRRLFAAMYDSLLVFAFLLIATGTVLLLRSGNPIAPDTLWFSALLLAVCFVFFGFFWTRDGQTLGMRTWRIRVVQTDGRAITWQQALVRFLVAILSWLAGGLGFFWILFDRQKRSWHDIASGTRLIYLGKS